MELKYDQFSVSNVKEIAKLKYLQRTSDTYFSTFKLNHLSQFTSGLDEILSWTSACVCLEQHKEFLFIMFRGSRFRCWLN